MKLLAYILSGQTLGLELETWETNSLQDHEPFIVIEDNDTIPTGYTDISSITSWGSLGQNTGLEFSLIRDELLKIKPSSLSGLTEQEIELLDFYQLKKYFLIYDFIERENNKLINGMLPPANLDYDILGLHKKRTFDKGEILTVEYFGNHNYFTKTYDDLLIKEERTYSRLNHMVYKREMAINWYLNDGTIGFTKNTVKFYATEEGIRAGETRRGNVITNLKITVVGLLMAASGITSVEAQEIGKPFINSYASEISKYIQGYEDELKDSINVDSTFEWLDLVIPNTGGITIRQYLISELTIDYSINNIDINV